MRDFGRDSLRFIQGVSQAYGDVVRYRIATMWWYQVNHPDGVRRVLQENNHNYPKSNLTRSILTPVLGNGLFTSEGGLWLRQRRLMQPAFHRRRVAAFGGIMADATRSMLERWAPMAESGTPVDVSAEMTSLTLQVASESLFHAHAGEEPAVVAAAVKTLVEEVNYRYQVPFYPPQSVPTPRNRKLRSALRTLDRAVYTIIDEHRRWGKGDDLLSLLMETRDADTGEAMGDRQLRDEVITLFIAGHETTASALSWAFYLISNHPEVEQRLRAELDEVLGPDAGRVPDVEDLPRLKYTGMVMDETMRLYPPAWIFDRQAVADDEVRGYRIPAGATVMISPYVLHRHPDFWDRPDEFDPERFSSEMSAGRPRYAYFPFGGGPRQCIGKAMALVEAQLILATVISRFRLVASRPIEPQPLVTLRPRTSLTMNLEPAR
jgi:cytochrome P450